MSLDEKFIPARNAFYDIVGTFFRKIAGLFGYPTNPGMPTISDLPSDLYSRARFLDSLPNHKTFWPPIQRPETWFDMIFGPAPKVEAVPRYIYERKEEGFYNFYIEKHSGMINATKFSTLTHKHAFGVWSDCKFIVSTWYNVHLH